MSSRKLAVLGYATEAVDWENDEQIRELVAWLEDQYICLYKIEDRAGLRSSDGDSWTKEFAKYLGMLKCPLAVDKTPTKELVEWLVDYAISILYSKNSEANTLTASKLLKMRKERNRRQKANDPISALDLNSAEFRKGIENLRVLLGLATHPDPLVVLRAACKFIVDNLTDKAIEQANKRGKSGDSKGKTMPLSRFDIGMLSTKNGSVDAAVRALRLIHLENLREVQTEINEAIVAVQEITADPKTDKRLGKVGF